MNTNASFFSVKSSLKGAVLLTGSTGYLGSLCLEQLLRCCPAVTSIYVLVRDQQSQSAEHRVRRVMHSGLFNQIRDKPALLSKVVLLKGDLSVPGVLLPEPVPDGTITQRKATPLAAHASTAQVATHNGSVMDKDVELGSVSSAVVTGSKPTDEVNGISADISAHSGASISYWDAEGARTRVGSLQQLRGEESVLVIHCAARIALNDPLKVTLKANYMGTLRLLTLAKSLPNIKGFVHVSTAYANACKPFLPEGTVHERMYPLCFGDQPVEHGRLVQQVLAMNDGLADARCSYLCELWGFPNSYVLGKHLTEQLVYETHSAQLPVAIARPALVGALAGKPYPGYVGNFAGPSGGALAYHMGFFMKHATTWSPWNHLDVIPGDVASSVILAASAAVLSAHAPMQDAPKLPSPLCSDCVASPSPQPCCAGDGDGVKAVLYTAKATEPLILHAASSSLSVCSFYEGQVLCKQFYKEYKAHHRRFRLGSNMPADPSYHPDPSSVRCKLAHKWLKFKVHAAGSLLRCFGHDKAARHLIAGHKAWAESQDPRNNGRLFFDVRNVLALEQRMSAEERQDFPLTWRGDWSAYANTYMAAVLALFMNQPVPSHPANDFVLIPNRRVA